MSKHSSDERGPVFRWHDHSDLWFKTSEVTIVRSCKVSKRIEATNSSWYIGGVELLGQTSCFEASSLNPRSLKPQPSNFEASTVKIWSLNPENFEAPSLNRQILKPQASILKMLKPQPSNFEASSLKFWELKPQSSIFEASSLQFWSLNRQIWSLKPQILKPLVLKSSGAILCNNPPLKTSKFPTFLRVPFLFLSFFLWAAPPLNSRILIFFSLDFFLVEILGFLLAIFGPVARRQLELTKFHGLMGFFGPIWAGALSLRSSPAPFPQSPRPQTHFS